MSESDYNPNEPVTETQEVDRQGDSDSRRCGRVSTEYLHVLHDNKLYGYVVDMSATGARVFRKGPFPLADGSFSNFTLQWRDVTVPVQVQVVWSRKVGFRKFLFGLKFVNLNDSQKTALTEMGHLARNSVHLASQEYEPERHGDAPPPHFRPLP